MQIECVVLAEKRSSDYTCILKRQSFLEATGWVYRNISIQLIEYLTRLLHSWLQRAVSEVVVGDAALYRRTPGRAAVGMAFQSTPALTPGLVLLQWLSPTITSTSLHWLGFMRGAFACVGWQV